MHVAFYRDTRGVVKEAQRLSIPPDAKLVWSDEENRMVWRRPEK